MTVPRQANDHLLGTPRFDRYVRDCGGDRDLAHELYLWNIQASGAMYEAIHVVEVLVRNTIDRELRIWNTTLDCGPDWLLDPNVHLARLLRDGPHMAATIRAKRAAAEKGRAVSHDDVLAQMTLGSWRYLLPSRANAAKRRLWIEATSHAFPEWPGPWPNLVTRIELIHDVRNRVAHLEPLNGVDLRAVRRSMRDVSHAISWDAGRFFVETERLIPVIECRPRLAVRQ
jgi:hypothetical protein